MLNQGLIMKDELKKTFNVNLCTDSTSIICYKRRFVAKIANEVLYVVPQTQTFQITFDLSTKKQYTWREETHTPCKIELVLHFSQIIGRKNMNFLNLLPGDATFKDLPRIWRN